MNRSRLPALAGAIVLAGPLLLLAVPAAEPTAPTGTQAAEPTATPDTSAAEPITTPDPPAAEPSESEAPDKEPKPPEGNQTEPEETPAATEPGEYRSWFDVSVGGLMVHGDEAAAQSRFGLPASAFGGVEQLHFEQDVGKKGLFKLDARSLFDNDDYDLRAEYSKPDIGFVRGGLRQYRVYSDGSGGWFPGNNQWFDLYDDRLELIRGTAFFEAGLRLPKLPEITVRYVHDWRDGQKDSSVWGDTGLTGGAGVRSIVPTFLDLDEKTDAVTLDVRHTLGATTFGAAFTYEHSDVDDSRNIRRRPFEASDRHVTQKEEVQTDLYNARAFVDTIFNPKLRLTTAYSFTSLDTDLGGSRIVGSDYDPVYDPINARRDVGFRNLTGGSRLDQHVWNVNMMWNPWTHLAVIPAFRLENQALDGTSAWIDTGAGDIPRTAANSRDMLDLSQQLEVRYTGITNVVLYARGDWVQGDGNLLEHQVELPSATTEIYRDSEFDRFSQKYAAGAHWYPHRQVNLHAQYYRKMRDNRYDEDRASYINLYGVYPGFLTAQDFTTDDVNLRITWRPLDKLTLITRYDFQLNTLETQGEGLDKVESGESTAHILSETITWTPLAWLYIQPGVHYVLDKTRSDASRAVTVPGSPVEDARNDFFNVACTVGAVLDAKTDVQLQYTWYLADNFNDISPYSQPYGAATEEHGILASLIRRISPRLRVTLRYGFFTSRSELAGGFNDYDSHLVSASAQYAF